MDKIGLPKKEPDYLLIILPLVAIASVVFVFSRPQTKDPQTKQETPAPFIVKLRKEEIQDPLIGIDEKFTFLKNLISEESGTYGLYVKDLSNDLQFGINTTQEFYAASLFKIPIAVATLRAYQDEVISPTTPIEYTNLDHVQGTGVISKLPYGTKLEASYVLTQLIKTSDNSAQSMLLRTIYAENIQNSFNFLSTDPLLSKFYRYNITNPPEIGLAFEYLYIGKYLTDDNKAHLINLMIDTSFEDRISAYLDEDLKFAHKIGSWPRENSWHDCGIVFGKDKEIIVCLMSKDTSYASFLRVCNATAEFINGM